MCTLRTWRAIDWKMEDGIRLHVHLRMGMSTYHIARLIVFILDDKDHVETRQDSRLEINILQEIIACT